MEWDYNIEDDIETLHTDGPLHDPVIVLVCGSTGSLCVVDLAVILLFIYLKTFLS